MTAGYLPELDIGEYTAATEGLNTLPRLAIGEYDALDRMVGALPALLIGEQPDASPFFNFGALGRLAFGEQDIQSLAALGVLDIGEYPYIGYDAPAGEVFPVLAGLGWDVGQKPLFSTGVNQGLSLRELRTNYTPEPLWELTMQYDMLRAAAAYLELQQISGFFQARLGRFESFLFANPNDYTVTNQSFGTGDGETVDFQLRRTFGAGGFTSNETVGALATLTDIKLDGVLVITAGTTPPLGPLDNSADVSSTGMVTFAYPPGEGVALTWSGTYYYRCRFMEDTMELEEFMYNLWRLGKLSLLGSVGNLI